MQARSTRTKQKTNCLHRSNFPFISCQQSICWLYINIVVSLVCNAACWMHSLPVLTLLFFSTRLMLWFMVKNKRSAGSCEHYIHEVLFRWFHVHMLRVDNEVGHVCTFLSWTSKLSKLHLTAFVETHAPSAPIRRPSISSAGCCYKVCSRVLNKKKIIIIQNKRRRRYLRKAVKHTWCLLIQLNMSRQELGFGYVW